MGSELQRSGQPGGAQGRENRRAVLSDYQYIIPVIIQGRFGRAVSMLTGEAGTTIYNNVFEIFPLICKPFRFISVVLSKIRSPLDAFYDTVVMSRRSTLYGFPGLFPLPDCNLVISVGMQVNWKGRAWRLGWDSFD